MLRCARAPGEDPAEGWSPNDCTMKYTFGILLLLALSQTAHSQQTPQLYVVAGDTVQRVTVSLDPIQTNLTSLVDSLSKILPDGQWCITNKADTIRCRCRFTLAAGHLEGRFTEFNAAGRAEAVRHYERGKANGLLVYWSSTGSLRTLETLKNGKLNGTRVSFNDNGRVQSVSYWYDGTPIGSKTYLFPRRNKILHQLFSAEEVAGKNILRLVVSP